MTDNFTHHLIINQKTKEMKSLKFMSLILLVLVVSFSNAIADESQKKELITISEFKPVQSPITYSDNVIELNQDGRLFAQANIESGVTPQDVSDIIDEKVIPSIEAISEQIDKAPGKLGSPIDWVTWGISAVMALVGTLMGIFGSGGENSKWKNLRLD